MIMTFNEIYSEYHDTISKFVKHKVRNLMDAEEIIQDVFIKISTSIENYNEEISSLKTWIFNITKNTIIDYHRKSNHTMVSIDEFTDPMNDDSDRQPIELESKDADPLAAMINQEALDKIRLHLRLLPDRYCHIASLFYISEFSLNEIAEEVGEPLSTIKTKLKRTRDMLRFLKITI